MGNITSPGPLLHMQVVISEYEASGVLKTGVAFPVGRFMAPRPVLRTHRPVSFIEHERVLCLFFSCAV
jgi:hypothetical protein